MRQVKPTVFRSPSTFGHRPCDILSRNFDITQLTMNTVLATTSYEVVKPLSSMTRIAHLRVDDQLLTIPTFFL